LLRGCLELLAAALLSARAKAKAGLAEIVGLRVDRTAMRADRSDGPQHAFEVLESGGFIVKIGFAEKDIGTLMPLASPADPKA
jgi:hypothetical protein